jgi:putative flippase GtrA
MPRTIRPGSAKASAPWFVAVGAAATLVHFGVVLALVSLGGVAPLAANGVAWCVAFGVSFVGHWRLSFAAQRAPLWRSARRFLLISALGFGANQLAYAWLLAYSGWGYASALAVVLAGVAAATFVAGRRWGFAPG